MNLQTFNKNTQELSSTKGRQIQTEKLAALYHCHASIHTNHVKVLITKLSGNAFYGLYRFLKTIDNVKQWYLILLVVHLAWWSKE